MQRPPVTGTARLLIMINGAVYTLKNLNPDPTIADPAWRLTKEDGTSYDVHVDEWGASCTCPDYVYSRQNEEKKCKHCEALRATGLLVPRGR